MHRDEDGCEKRVKHTAFYFAYALCSLCGYMQSVCVCVCELQTRCIPRIDCHSNRHVLHTDLPPKPTITPYIQTIQKPMRTDITERRAEFSFQQKKSRQTTTDCSFISI